MKKIFCNISFLTAIAFGVTSFAHAKTTHPPATPRVTPSAHAHRANTPVQGTISSLTPTSITLTSHRHHGASGESVTIAVDSHTKIRGLGASGRQIKSLADLAIGNTVTVRKNADGTATAILIQPSSPSFQIVNQAHPPISNHH